MHSLNGAVIHQQVMVEKVYQLILMEHQESMALAVVAVLAGPMEEMVEPMLVEVDQATADQTVQELLEQQTLAVVAVEHLMPKAEQ
jgi:hypothetical protein